MKKSTKSEKPAAPQAKSVEKKTVEPVSAKKTAAPRKVPTPKKSTASAMPAPASAPAAPSTPPSTPAPAPVRESHATTIVAQLDVGYGNELFVRGEGPGLSWERGTRMSCVADDRWILSIDGASKNVVFKFLRNDETWSTGEDYVVAPGGTTVLTPSF